MKRRDFLKLSATAGAVSCITACGSEKAETVTPEQPLPEQANWTTCSCNCQASCPIKVISQDGVCIRLETDFSGDDTEGNLKSMACVRGRSSRQKMYAPERLKVPMKRVGKRGEGLFEEISWDEAYQTIADNMTRIIQQYGNEAIFWPKSSGRIAGNLVSDGWTKRLLKLMGGYVDYYGSYSNAQYLESLTLTHGGYDTFFAGPTTADMANSDLILAFGFNPMETRMSGTGGGYELTRYTSGIPMVIVDPRYTDTAIGRQDTWLPIRPGTDVALVEAIIYQLVVTGRVDDAWVDRYCSGWTESALPAGAPEGSSYKSYIMGLGEDGTVKTPERAAKITGLPEDQIIELAQRLADAESPFICQGWGPQRTANGEQTARAIMVLPWILGKVGTPGTNFGTWPNFAMMGGFNSVPQGDNPVKTVVSVFKWIDAIKQNNDKPETIQTALKDGVRGADQLKVPFKFVWNYAGNILINQHSDVLETKKVLADDSMLEFMVVHDYALTPTAMFADILLPDLIDMECDDLVSNGASNQLTLIHATSSLTPFFSAKSSFDVCAGVAEKLGIKEQFTEGLTYQQWVERIYAESQAMNPALPPYEEFKEMGVLKVPPMRMPGAFSGFIADPEGSPLMTPSGKIEVYSSTLQTRAETWELPEGDVITPTPQYLKAWEGAEDEETKKEFPLQLVGYHTKGRTHSSFHNIPWLREVVEDAVWMNPADATSRGISGGEQVIIESKRGKVQVRVKVTPRIRPGVVALGEGAWSKHMGNVDVGGNINTLTKYHPSPIAKGNPQHTNLVEISLA